ncbi:MAG: oligosaccharide flippase family protein [Actinomycetales bacterium]|nr:oligosaccharide flippase family protein [Candidatus Phosphoribacter baldrii]
MPRMPLASLTARARQRLGATGEGVAAIIMATAAAQGLAFLGYPIVARLYTPHDFGTLATVTAWSMLLMPVMAIRADVIVPLPASDDTSRRIVGLGVRAVLVNTLLVAAAFTGLYLTGHDFDLEAWIFSIPMVSALLALFQLANAWAIRRRRYSTIAGRNVIQALVTLVTQTAFGVVAASAFGLIAGLVLALVVSTLFLAVANKSRPFDGPTDASEAAAPNRPDDLSAPVVTGAATTCSDDVRAYVNQAPALSLAGLLNAAGLYAPPLLITTFFGLADAGQFGLAQRVVAIPIALLGQATAQVYLGWLSETKRAGQFGALRALRKATRLLLLAAVPMGLIVLVASPSAFPLLFGERWGVAGSMAAALSINLAAQLVAAPVSQTLIVLGHARLQLAWDAGRFTLVVGSLLACVHFEVGVVATVWTSSLASAVAYVLSWGLSRWAAAVEHRSAPAPQP